MVLEAARRDPSAIALEQRDERLTYGELAARAQRLARGLRRQGVRSDEPVGLCLERSPQRVVAQLAIWLAGAAYVPLSPSLPPARLRSLAAATGARRVVCSAHLVERLGEVRARLLDLSELAYGTPQDAPLPPLEPARLAYVLFTSGSTGSPQGSSGHPGQRSPAGARRPLRRRRAEAGLSARGAAVLRRLHLRDLGRP